jgi:hypothetical protein
MTNGISRPHGVPTPATGSPEEPQASAAKFVRLLDSVKTSDTGWNKALTERTVTVLGESSESVQTHFDSTSTASRALLAVSLDIGAATQADGESLGAELFEYVRDHKPPASIATSLAKDAVEKCGAYEVFVGLQKAADRQSPPALIPAGLLAGLARAAVEQGNFQLLTAHLLRDGAHGNNALPALEALVDECRATNSGTARGQAGRAIRNGLRAAIALTPAPANRNQLVRLLDKLLERFPFEVDDNKRADRPARRQITNPAAALSKPNPADPPNLHLRPSLTSGPQDTAAGNGPELNSEPSPLIPARAPGSAAEDLTLGPAPQPADEWSAVFEYQRSFDRRPDLAKLLTDAFRAAAAADSNADHSTPAVAPARADADWQTRATLALDARLLLARAARDAGCDPTAILEDQPQGIDGFLASQPAIKEAVEPLVRIERCLQSLDEEELPNNEDAITQLILKLAAFELHKVPVNAQHPLGTTLFSDFRALFRSNDVIAQMTSFIQEMSDESSKEAHQAVLDAYLQATYQPPAFQEPHENRGPPQEPL